MELFRKEAIEALRTPSLGSIRLATPLSHSYAAAFAVAVCVLIIAWATLGSYTRREKVSGSLVPDAGLVSLSSNASGVVTEVTVHIGQAVKVGQPLVTISGEKSSEVYGATQAQVGEDLREEIARLKLDIQSAKTSADTQAKALSQQGQQLDVQMKQIDSELQIAQHQQSELSNLISRMDPLVAKGYISPLQIESERSDERTAESQVHDLIKQRHALMQQASELSAQLDQLPLTRDDKINDLSRQLLQIQQSLVNEEASRLSVITAPVNGVVSSALVRNGQNVTSGTLLLSIVPKGSPLQAQLLVPSSSIGFVHVGTDVALHFQAFPYQKFGIQHGVVTDVSRSALSPSEVTALLGEAAPTDPMYLVYAQLPSQAIQAYGEDLPLTPGMTVDADLLLDHRKVIEWLLEPLFAMKQGNRG